MAHLVSRTGSYLSQLAGINEGDPLAYLIAPPLEAAYGVDAAIKAADVQKLHFRPGNTCESDLRALTWTQPTITRNYLHI